jgi:hypothetical protein
VALGAEALEQLLTERVLIDPKAMNRIIADMSPTWAPTTGQGRRTRTTVNIDGPAAPHRSNGELCLPKRGTAEPSACLSA